MQREEQVTAQREKEYSCNLERFKWKMNTLVGMKEKVRSIVLSLLIKLSQVLFPQTQVKFGPNHIKSLCSFFITLLFRYYWFALHQAFLLQVLFILPNSANVDPESHNNRYQSISVSQQLVSKLKVDKGQNVEDRKFYDKGREVQWQRMLAQRPSTLVLMMINSCSYSLLIIL